MFWHTMKECDVLSQVFPFNLNIVQLEQQLKARWKKEENLRLSAFSVSLCSSPVIPVNSELAVESDWNFSKGRGTPTAGVEFPKTIESVEKRVIEVSGGF